MAEVKNKSWIVVSKNGKTVKKYAAVVINSGESGKIFFKGKEKKIVKKFKPLKNKPVVRMMIEQAILRYPDYDPAINSVTIVVRED